ncbi:MAG: hypothetical protein ACXVGR_10140 [Mycobacteriaceae bacterium]
MTSNVGETAGARQRAGAGRGGAGDADSAGDAAQDPGAHQCRRGERKDQCSKHGLRR